MALEGTLEYAATRVQAQHAGLPSEEEWRRLESSQDIGHFLDSARSGALSRWVSALDARQELHALERALRVQWRGYIEQLAAWHPRDWQAWLRWAGWLPTLPLLTPVSRARAPAWLRADPVVGPLLEGKAKPSFGPLASALGTHESIAGLWRQRWDQLLPHTDADTRTHLHRFLATLDRHASQRMSGAAPTVVLRRHLVQRLDVLFRQSAGTVVATACHLARLALELERLRGGLASRALLGSGLPGFRSGEG